MSKPKREVKLKSMIEMVEEFDKNMDEKNHRTREEMNDLFKDLDEPVNKAKADCDKTIEKAKDFLRRQKHSDEKK